MGIKTVAIYSELDSNSLHVRLADEAYALGGKTATESYLNTDAILNVIKKSKAEAVHPGYGFFSENTDFARAITDLGVVFVGPPPEAIEIMGDKISSRIAAEKAGVAGVPGRSESVKDPSEIEAFGKEFGYPVAIKAAYGGGGRGMKVVNSKKEVKEAMESAQREALGAFGRDEIYLEKYLDWPRHIEMQIFADTFGNAVWLGERDCSVQRRHQKLIEESPAPDFDDKIRQKMGESAVAVAKACGYVNAGTVEFLYQDGEFYFLEMNTRLQVEHPVTEAVVGMDLVKLQLKIASGEPLGFSQEDIQRKGHSFECRINAEDAAGGKFLPAPGPITKLVPPGGYGVRLDAGYESGDNVSQFYDNLIAKLITWGSDREEARLRMLRALSELKIEGTATIIDAQKLILQEPDFIKAVHSTRWLESKVDLSALTAQSFENKETSTSTNATTIVSEVNGKRFEVKLYIPEGLAMETKGSNSAVKSKPRSRTQQGAIKTVASGHIAVPMQGTVVKIHVAKGDIVKAGDTVITLEAMKMENAISSDIDGVVKEIKVKNKDAVSPGDVIAIIE